MSAKFDNEKHEKEYDINKGAVLTRVDSHDEISLSESDLNKNQNQFDDERIVEFFERLSDESVQHLLTKTGHGNDINHDNKDDLTFDLKFFLDKVINITNEKVLNIYAKTYEDHQGDANFPIHDWNFIESVINNKINIDENSQINFEAKLLAVLIHYHSPYPEVRAVTDLVNDLNEPIETIRSWTLAIIWLIIQSGIKEFFAHRFPSISLTNSVISILLYASGKLWEYVIPNVTINFFGKKLQTNPGPYSFKEQMFASLMTSVASANVYVSYNIVTQVKFYHQNWLTFGFQFLLVMSTQLMGFSFAGILRKFVVYPVRSMWPTILPSIALNRALLKPERKENINGWKISKFNFFWTAFGSMFLYFWIPNYLFQALSTFSWITWIKPYNFDLSMITGFNSGLGLNPVATFDWNIITSLISPLVLPFYVSVNVFGGMVVSFFVIVGIYYSNYKWTGYLPINSNGIFTNEGTSFKVEKVLTNGLLDNEKYQNYSPPFYTAANIVLYSAFFMFYPFAFLYNTVKEWKTIQFALILMYENAKESIQSIKNGEFFKKKNNDEKDHSKGLAASTLAKFEDPHSKMMAKYKEIPDSYYWAILVISLVLAILCVKVYPDTKTPVWGIFFTVGINFVFLIPLCILLSVTGQQMGLNVLVELIVGYALPGNGVAMMTLKALGYNIDGQADNFISCQKTAHYTRIPIRSVFRGQLIGTIIQAFVFLGVVNWSMSNIEGMCDPKQPQKFTCASERTFYASSVLWGVIGPKKVFDGLYPTMKYAFLIGFLVALLFIAIRKFAPKFLPNNFEPSVFITGFLNWAPYNFSYIITGMYFAFFFSHYIKRRYIAWFEKYNYVLSAALDAGVAFSAVIIFFAVQYHPKYVDWWGNNVTAWGIEGGEGQQSLYDITLTDRGYFGPERGHLP
ncbi:Oligopeptide transporter [Wickerhamomyces ciferrii]|uniref:Oligopeptide transporter n=1 Tax=Wickerhamomyces ciferrii (strain ATCC 14091 / BCRC 22168 / CBS 111 / JCM 3599 / NBRC 0793 / NRRL Y-1031 F-60-10) TaxID=1206466 RepID=K0KP44_WICCF|nr:Oligopeptide transporter [Wickerhamomyces ciferrii]CCH42883.1 Oligopeptide transporter [Wickerhamomyces ciferrii]